MGKLRPIALSIAGLDPSAGAGLLADIKTFEAHKVYGLGVASAITFQNDTLFEKVEWLTIDAIINQIAILKKRFTIPFIKIGLIENLEILEALITYLKTKDKEVLLMWDPILKASAGFNFHNKLDLALVEKICANLFLITPNIEEALQLGVEKDTIRNSNHLSNFCNVYLKGGHSETDKGRDFLFTKDKKQFNFKPKKYEVFEKHGSGCVLSSAITANIAKGMKLHRACLQAKGYTAEFLSSNKTLLGYHK